MTVVYAEIYKQSGSSFEPQLRIFYGRRSLDVADGLPKFMDLPTDLGGSGQSVEEPATTGMRPPDS